MVDGGWWTVGITRMNRPVEPWYWEQFGLIFRRQCDRLHCRLIQQRCESPEGRVGEKSAVVVWKILPLGIPEGHQTFPNGAAPRESLMTEGTPKGKFFRQPLRTFHYFSDFWTVTVKTMRPRVALGLTLNIFM